MSGDRPLAAATRVPLPRWAVEVLGAAVAGAIGIAVVAAVAASARSELLFRDGDSLVTTLVVQSIAVGQPQDWALSTVLFLPETAMLWVLSSVGLGVNGTLALAGVVNVLALYGALRVAAGRAVGDRMPVAGALLALTGFALLAASETSPSRDALELASLLATTTYYSATVIGVVLAVGLARRGIGAAPRPVPWGHVIGIGAVAAASVVTNPLFAAWATLPLGLVLIAAGLRERAALWLAGGLVLGSTLGFAGRMPLSGLIANTGAGYADPSQWLASLEYYGALLAERWGAPWGAASLVAIVLLWGWCVVATVTLARRSELEAAVVAACGWVMPLLVVIGAVALGTHAARYLQPAAFAPLFGLVVLPAVLTARSQARWRTAPRSAPSRDFLISPTQDDSAADPPAPVRSPALGDVARRESERARGRGRAAIRNAAIGVAAAAVIVAAVGLGVPRIAAAASAPDADLDCVVAWTERAADSGRTGAGQFWTVRLPKAHLADPRRLVQVDHRLRGYAWLVNRDDFAGGEVSFLVTDGASVPFELPAGVTTTDASAVACGRYTILDFGSRALPLGPQRS